MTPSLPTHAAAPHHWPMQAQMQEVIHASWQKLTRQQQQIDEMAEQLRHQQALLEPQTALLASQTALLENQTAELKVFRSFFQHPQLVAPVMTCRVIADT